MKRTVIGMLFLALSSMLISGQIIAEDWPQWRGPNRDDVSQETGLLQEWKRGGPEKVWSSDQGGLGYAGFAVVGEELYTMGLADNKEFVVCLDANTGKKKWSTNIGDRYENGWGDGPRSTPTIDGTFVYAMAGRGTLACLRRSNGAIVWKREMTQLGGSIPNWGYTESPLVDGNQVICTPGGSEGALAALNKTTGRVLWRSEQFKDNAEYSSVVMGEINGKKQYVQLTQKSLVGIQPNTGKLLWEVDWRGSVAVIPTPIIDGNQVYITSGYGAGCMKVRIGANNDVETVFDNKTMRNHHGGVIQLGDYYFGHSDRVGWVCQNAEDGEMVWRENRELGKGAIAYADNRFYCLDEKTGDVALIAATSDGWTQTGRFTLEPQSEQRSPRGAIWVHPVIANGKLYLRDQEIIHCYDVSAQ